MAHPTIVVLVVASGDDRVAFVDVDDADALGAASHRTDAVHGNADHHSLLGDQEKLLAGISVPTTGPASFGLFSMNARSAASLQDPTTAKGSSRVTTS